MGYGMQQRGEEFAIEVGKFGQALAALHDLCAGGKRFDWIDPDRVVATSTLPDAFEECRWPVELGADGSVDHIWFSGEKVGNDDQVFEAIAPFVKAGSFIEVQGEDGNLWRWVFDGVEVRNVSPTITWGEA